MLDNTQIVNTKELAKAVQGLSGLLLTEKQLTKKRITDGKGESHIVCPGMITRIWPTTLYEPLRKGAEIYYVNGQRFSIDLTVDELCQQLGID